jgi:AraC family transcriptional regulator of adaptative response/methylated-DNA-[protein]-cysteine methyltransferase
MVGAADEAGARLLEFGDGEALDARLPALGARLGAAVVPGENAHLEALRGELDAYFGGGLREFSVPLVYPGTPFEVRVWDALRAIPYGATCSYLDVARKLGDPGALRAVGQANNRNPLAIVIPCHRVINAPAGLALRGLTDAHHGLLPAPAGRTPAAAPRRSSSATAASPSPPSSTE